MNIKGMMATDNPQQCSNDDLEEGVCWKIKPQTMKAVIDHSKFLARTASPDTDANLQQKVRELNLNPAYGDDRPYTTMRGDTGSGIDLDELIELNDDSLYIDMQAYAVDISNPTIAELFRKTIEELNDKEILTIAKEFKKIGNEKFKSINYYDCERDYRHGILILEKSNDTSEKFNLLWALQSNLINSLIKQEEFDKARTELDKLDCSNVTDKQKQAKCLKKQKYYKNIITEKLTPSSSEEPPSKKARVPQAEAPPAVAVKKSELDGKLDFADKHLEDGGKAYSDNEYETAEALYREGIELLTSIKDSELDGHGFERKAKTLWETQVALVESIIKQGRPAAEEKKMITCMGNNIQECEDEKRRVNMLQVAARKARYIAKDEHGNPRNPPPSKKDFIREIHEKIREYGGGNFRANYDQNAAARVVYNLTNHYLKGDDKRIKKLKQADIKLSKKLSTYENYSIDVLQLIHHDYYVEEVLAGELFKIVTDLLELNYTYIPPTEQQPRQQAQQQQSRYGHYQETAPPEDLIKRMVTELEQYIQILIAQAVNMSRFENIKQKMIDYLRGGHSRNQITDKAITLAVDRMSIKYRNKEGVFASVFEPPPGKMEDLIELFTNMGLPVPPNEVLKSELYNAYNNVETAFRLLTAKVFRDGGSKRRRPTLRRTKKRKTNKIKTTKKKKKTRKKKKRSTKRKRR
uniref:Uncharacterized protein n=1 Tax=viral metagenome TaxID=1070528 RepID=A0A6C0CD04_9ZZZZ